MVWLPGKSESGEGETPYVARLFVTAANTNSVYTLGVSEGKELRLLETINTAMTPRQPAGMTPSALALAPDGKHLYVVCSDGNVVAVVDVSADRSHVEGFVPTGWYPTAARALADGTLVVLNGRGSGSHPNPKGPNPARRPEASHVGSAAVEYVGRIQTGTASFIERFDQEQLQAYTKTVSQTRPYRDEKLDMSNPFPPIEHVIYIVKENRTYDQVFGDIKQGNGDPSLVLFGEKITPNHHKLARQFVLLDNFYVNSDVSADGHDWSTSAIAHDYIQKMWPNSYASRRDHYDYEGQEATAAPPAGYLWTSAAGARISMRNYGYIVEKRAEAAPDGSQVETVRDPMLKTSPTVSTAPSISTIRTWSGRKSSWRILRNLRKRAQMPKMIFMRLRQ